MGHTCTKKKNCCLSEVEILTGSPVLYLLDLATVLLPGRLKEQEDMAALWSLAHGVGTSHFQIPRPQLISWNSSLAERTCLIWSLINLHSPLPSSSWAWCCSNELKLVMNRNSFMWNSTDPWALGGPFSGTSIELPHDQAYHSEQF